MTKTGPLDRVERAIRLALGVALLLLAWGFDWSGVEGIGFVVLGALSLATGAWGFSPADRALAALPRRPGG